MTTSFVLLSDTHLPKRAKDLPAGLWADIDAADLVVHAGDWVDLATLDAVQARSARFEGVLAVAGGREGLHAAAPGGDDVALGAQQVHMG